MRNLKKLAVIGGASALLAVTALTGCESSHSGDRSAGRALDDKMITESVEDKLKHEPVYKFTDVDVKTFGGVVQLSGFVDTDEQKNRAGELARNIDGVSQVVNNITLKPANRTLEPTGRTNSLQHPNPAPNNSSTAPGSNP